MRRFAPSVRLARAARLAPLVLAVPLIPPPAIARAESAPRAASRAAFPPFAAPPATVVQVLPPSHDPSVTPSTSLIVTFAEPLDPTTLTSSSFFATGARTGLHTGPITYDPLTQTAPRPPSRAASKPHARPGARPRPPRRRAPPRQLWNVIVSRFVNPPIPSERSGPINPCQ